MILAALVFFAPDWPRRLTRAIRVARAAFNGDTTSANDAGPVEPVPAVGRVRLVLLGLLAVVQLVLPLRHYAVDGNVRWTEEGYYLAWRVMLTEKAGHVEYAVTDPSSGDTWTADPGLVLTDWQAAHAATRPDMVHATARLIADHYRRQGVANPEVRADAWVTMNGRPARRLVDPEVDLAAHARGSLPPGWILDP